jgi:peptide/nickel transport system substrate-binding protein
MGPSDMHRRDILKSAGWITLAAPAIARSAGERVLKFIPQSDLAALDPVWTSATVTRNHAYLVFDTLFAQDHGFGVQPQMLAGYTVENDGKLWRLTLRDGLLFHDGTPVLARDCVASIQRWAKRDGFGQVLLRTTAELLAPDDRTIVFRLRSPFPLLPEALGKTSPSMLPIVPERLARVDPYKQMTEMVGSGPYRFLTDEHIAGARASYARFDRYLPRESGTPDWVAGPKRVWFDRIEWNVIPDAATAAAAIQSGEADWWEVVDFDLLDLVRRDPALSVFAIYTTGNLALLRMNQVVPPFDNPAIRRALLGAVDQSAFMQAVAGADRSAWRVDVGYFSPQTPMASEVGMAALLSPRNYSRVRDDIRQAGYQGEKVPVLIPSDFSNYNALGLVAADMLEQCGFNVEAQTTDWGTVLQRRTSKAPISQGGWGVFCTSFAGVDMASPATNLPLRGTGADAWFGWPDAPKIEALRERWFAAADLSSQQGIAREIQAQAFIDVPYLPLGQYFQQTVQRKTLTGTLSGLPIFWNVQRN